LFPAGAVADLVQQLVQGAGQLLAAASQAGPEWPCRRVEPPWDRAEPREGNPGGSPPAPVRSGAFRARAAARRHGSRQGAGPAAVPAAIRGACDASLAEAARVPPSCAAAGLTAHQMRHTDLADLASW